MAGVVIPEGYLGGISDAINRLSAEGQDAARALIDDIIDKGGTDNPFDLVEDIAEALEPVLQAMADGTAALSATSYDVVRLAAVGEALGARPFADRAGDRTLKAIYGCASQHRSNMDAFERAILDRVDYEAKRAAGSTMFANGARDRLRPRFARVPTGPETCPFCVMLASRGFVYLSEETAGKLDHYHAHCDCRVVPKFGSESYEGYDPEAYYRQYERLMEEGELDAERLSRSSARAKRRRREGKTR